MSEARELTEDRIRKLAALPLQDLLRYEEHPVREQVTGSSGRSYRIHTYAFWDMDPGQSDLFVRVDLRGTGLRRWQRYHGIQLRWPEENAGAESPDPPKVSSTWTENCACLTLALIVLGLPLSALYAIRKLLT
ncbi:MAG TPA: hypothetical protein VGV34_08395 [Solirubrobacterales bacterium]|nr:hypothetical protein [Solirubrobacterales bacterium]